MSDRDPRASSRSMLRLFVLRILVLSLLATLLGRLWFLQVADGSDFVAAAADNRVREVVTPAARGQILDARGRALVRNRTALVVSVTRSTLLREPDDGAAVLARLSRLVGVPVAELDKLIRPCGPGVERPCWNGSPYQPVPVLRDASPQIALAIEEHREDFPGVQAGVQAVRAYPFGAASAHQLGYVSPITEEELARFAEEGKAGYRRTSEVGRAGLEQQYDEVLRGVDGVERVTVDRFGTVTGLAGSTPASGGGNLVLSIDAGVQQLADAALARGLQRVRTTLTDREGTPYRADAGAVVVLDPRSGRVLALSSAPSYDPSLFVGGIGQADFARLSDEAAGVPLISRATQGLFAPASTFKIISTAAAVQDGYPLGGSYDCPGSFPVGSRSFRNFESRPLGAIDLRTSLVKSCDTIYYRFAYEQWLRDEARVRARAKPTEPMVRMAQAFGLGRKTGIDLPTESGGRVADRTSKAAHWAATKAGSCARSRGTYPGVDPTRVAYLRQIDRENCVDGYRYRAGDAVNFSIGQGDTVVTPLQLAAAYGALANGGTVWQPLLARAVLAPGGRVIQEFAPTARGRVPVSPGVLAYIRSALAAVPSEGTGVGAFGPREGKPAFPLDRVAVAGKTGTGQVAGKQDTAWFASFAPAAAPTLVVVAMVSQGGQGGRAAAPIVREVYEGIFGLTGAPPVLPGGQLPAALPRLAPDGTLGGAAPARSMVAPTTTPAPATTPPPPVSGAARAPRTTGSGR